MLRFLPPREQQQMQLGNKFCYNVAVGRVVTRYTFGVPLIPFRSNARKIGLYDLQKQKAHNIQNQKYLGDAYWINFVQYFGHGLFIYYGKVNLWCQCRNINA